MKSLRATAAIASVAFFMPASALGRVPTPTHIAHYNRLYREVAQKLGRRVPGRNIIRDGLSTGRGATDAIIVSSVAVLERMLAPPAPVVTAPSYTSAPGTTTTYTTAPSSGLAACIISRESGGNPTATNGQYSGIAQWSPSAWASMGGTKYASSPTSASYSQQVEVLNSALAAGQSGQWTPYDGC